MYKIALLSYHSNHKDIYRPHWIDKYKDSILDQTYHDVDIFEFDYSGNGERIFENSYFESRKYPTFVHALNYLLDKVFSAGYYAAMNTNVDDYYRHDTVERLYDDMKRGDYDLATCNFCLVRDDRVIKYHRFHALNVLQELERGHNPVAHPAIMYNKSFWKTNKYDPDEIPYEDMNLWLRALRSGSTIHINEQNLLFHRLHTNAVCQSSNR